MHTTHKLLPNKHSITFKNTPNINLQLSKYPKIFVMLLIHCINIYSFKKISFGIESGAKYVATGVGIGARILG